MADYDLTSRIAPHLDRHLVFPLLEFLQERELYADDEILKAKIQLLSQTNMVDYAMDIHKALYHTEDVPQDMVGRRVEVVARLKSLEESAAPLISFLQNASLVQELRPDKQYNIQMLHDRFQVCSWIEALYQYAKFQFECGNYSGAADYLYQYRALCTNSERNLSALWGKLAAEILMQNWDTALEELNRLKEIIDSKVILNDPFLGKRVEDSNFATVPLRDEFLENARLFVFETYCRIHRCIDIRHEQIIEAMKNLNMRTYLLAKNIVEPAQAAQATR
ncbi:hypothetical protein GW17_00032575 [Ensete ventricosum]|uniref:Uncharacterized protein n=1 Tax=Ensete ventricosum TaxID=4639 RepID=A0A427AWT6_ENSVE|nr:hypothetical protein B296_00004109 [Ensete ventricosum]RWW04215.1 hypothetical protein GW17_00032575 [Ensete ventricosum]